MFVFKPFTHCTVLSHTVYRPLQVLLACGVLEKNIISVYHTTLYCTLLAASCIIQTCTAHCPIQVLLARGVLEEKVILLCIIAAPEGIHRICSRFPKVRVVTSQIDEKVDAAFCVVPGCGEFGDRWVAAGCWLGWFCFAVCLTPCITVQYSTVQSFVCLALFGTMQCSRAWSLAACHAGSFVNTCNAWLRIVMASSSAARQIVTTMQHRR
jgi:hypothetical protein